MSAEPGRVNTAPLGELSPRVKEYLENAMDEMRQQGEQGYDRAMLLTRARAEARDANRASNEDASDQDRVEALSRANARVAAAASLDVKEFPIAVSVEALIAVANLSVSLGRSNQIDGDLDAALGAFMLGLDLVRVYRAYTRVASVDQITYGVASRATVAAGELAAERTLSLDRALDALDRNIITPYATMMQSEELSGPRAFGVVALLRRALVLGNDGHIAQLRSDIADAYADLVPATPAARIRFETDMKALLEEVDVRLGQKKRGTFEW